MIITKQTASMPAKIPGVNFSPSLEDGGWVLLLAVKLVGAAVSREGRALGVTVGTELGNTLGSSVDGISVGASEGE